MSTYYLVCGQFKGQLLYVSNVQIDYSAKTGYSLNGVSTSDCKVNAHYFSDLSEAGQAAKILGSQQFTNVNIKKTTKAKPITLVEDDPFNPWNPFI